MWHLIMTTNSTHSDKTGPIARPSSAGHCILLLADDGRMARLIDQALPRSTNRHQVHPNDQVLPGLVQLGTGNYDLVLLNAEALGYKTTEAVCAMRRIVPEVPIILYGQAYAEIYAQPALNKGANDFLTWPIPFAQIKTLINNPASCQTKSSLPGGPSATRYDFITPLASPERQPIQTNTQDNNYQAMRSQLLEHYHELARLIPQGKAVLVQQAQKILQKTFSLQWCKIITTPIKDNGRSTVQDQSTDSQTIKLTGPQGNVGYLQLGTADNGRPVPPELLQYTATMIGTLVYLTLRDENLRHLATVDELTGAYNRRYLEYFMQQVIDQNQHEHTEVTLLIFDIDEFKHYNDTYGHAAGDDILRQATKLIRRCCREHDIVARIGGDEFAVLFWDTGYQRPIYQHHNSDNGFVPPPADHPSKTHAEIVMFMSNRFRRIMNTSDFPGLGPEARGKLTISGGLARFPQDGASVQELLSQADIALLNAKRSGKNRIYIIGRPE